MRFQRGAVLPPVSETQPTATHYVCFGGKLIAITSYTAEISLQEPVTAVVPPGQWVLVCEWLTSWE